MKTDSGILSTILKAFSIPWSLSEDAVITAQGNEILLRSLGMEYPPEI